MTHSFPTRRSSDLRPKRAAMVLTVCPATNRRRISISRSVRHADKPGAGSLADMSFAHHSLTNRRSEEHTSELQSLMRISYAVFCLKKKKYKENNKLHNHRITYPIRTKVSID